MLEDPSPSGSGRRRRVRPSISPTASTMRALFARIVERIPANRASCTPATAPASSPMRKFSPVNGSVSSSPRALA